MACAHLSLLKKPKSHHPHASIEGISVIPVDDKIFHPHAHIWRVDTPSSTIPIVLT